MYRIMQGTAAQGLPAGTLPGAPLQDVPWCALSSDYVPLMHFVAPPRAAACVFPRADGSIRYLRMHRWVRYTRWRQTSVAEGESDVAISANAPEKSCLRTRVSCQGRTSTRHRRC